MPYEDILYDPRDGVAWITINRPEVRNAFRAKTVDELIGAFRARVVGEKKAREIWYLCRQYGAGEALAMGLVNRVVPAAELRAETERWCRELLEKSPTALRLAKQSFNADTEHIAGITELGFSALELYYQTDEALEGRNAFLEKRPPRFRKPRS